MAGELRNTILNAEDISKELVDIPEWGVAVEVRGLTASERFRILQVAVKDGQVDFKSWFPELVISSAYDPASGEKLFEPADRDTLLKKSGKAIGLIADVASRLSGLSDTDMEVAKSRFQEQS